MGPNKEISLDKDLKQLASNLNNKYKRTLERSRNHAVHYKY
jgi:hypothetical protein